MVSCLGIEVDTMFPRSPLSLSLYRSHAMFSEYCHRQDTITK